MNNSVISMKNVTYTYPGSQQPVLRDINLEIKEGNFTVIMGMTGAGKTTLAVISNGIIPQLLEGTIQGTVISAGMDLSQYRTQTITKKVGLVLQDPDTQIFGRSVEEDVAFGPRNYLVPREEIFQRIEASLQKVRLGGYQKRLTSQLSGGEKQRLAIAGILAMNPSIIILDEPTSELDPLGREEIYSTIQGLQHDRNMTIIAVEHSSQEISEKADEIVILNDTHIVWQGDPRVFFKKLDLVEKNGIKPLPVSKIGWELCKKGYIREEEIPLNVEEAYQLICRLLGNRNLSTNVKQETAVGAEEILIQAEDVFFRYESGKEAVNGVTLKVYKGDYIALIGQNGAGKTTLAKHFNSIYKPTRGKVTVCGLDISKEEPDTMAKHIGYVFQNPDHQIFSTTVYKELAYGLKNEKLSDTEIDERIYEVARFIGLEKVLEEHPFSLGKGERQKIAVASILVLKPEILVVDEPTTGQDWNGIRNMMELFDQLHRNGTTLIMITHDMDVVARHASRTVVLCHGQVVLDGKTEEVFEHKDILEKAFVSRPQIMELSDQLKARGLNRLARTEEELTEIILTGLEAAK